MGHASVVAVHRSASHSFSKFAEEAILLVEGLGVEGDAHSGGTVKHQSRVARDPTQPNLRQVLRIGAATVEVTGLRNPCSQIDRFQPGLMAAVLDRDEQGGLLRKAGVMAVVVAAGPVRPGDPIRIDSVPLSYTRLAPV